jgi:hypothetical protein
MPVLAKFHGIVIRLLYDRTFGIRLHAFYGDAELVIGLKPLKIIQGDAPDWVRDWALDWARQHEAELVCGWGPVPTALRVQDRRWAAVCPTGS